MTLNCSDQPALLTLCLIIASTAGYSLGLYNELSSEHGGI